jgi:uncharacterized protein YwgA
MTQQPASTRDQHALIAFIANEIGSSVRLGKKAMQKLVYLLQEIGSVPLGYRFNFYTYGPYSSDLSGDLDIVALRDGVSVSYEAAENSYAICPGSRNESVVQSGIVFLKKHHKGIKETLDLFGRRSAKELELIATVVFLHRHGEPLNRHIAPKVKELKPKYDSDTISAAVEEVRSLLQ